MTHIHNCFFLFLQPKEASLIIQVLVHQLNIGGNTVNPKNGCRKCKRPL